MSCVSVSTHLDFLQVSHLAVHLDLEREQLEHERALRLPVAGVGRKLVRAQLTQRLGEARPLLARQPEPCEFQLDLHIEPVALRCGKHLVGRLVERLEDREGRVGRRDVVKDGVDRFLAASARHVRVVACHCRLGILEQRAVGPQRLFVLPPVEVDLGLLLVRLEPPA